MRQYVTSHLVPRDVPEVRTIGAPAAPGKLVQVEVGGESLLVASADHLRSFCASIIAQIDALEGGEAA